MEPGSSVALVVAAPYPRVPSVVGKSEASAIRKLKNAGFKVKKTTQTRTTGKDGVVLSQSRPGGTRAKPNSVVRIVISNVQSPPATKRSAPRTVHPGAFCAFPKGRHRCNYTGYAHDLQDDTTRRPRTLAGPMICLLSRDNRQDRHMESAASMPTARAYLGGFLGSDGRLYAIGGYNDSGYLSVVEAYDPSTNAWSAVAPLEIPLVGLAVASVNNRLLAIGGEQVNGPNGFLSQPPRLKESTALNRAASTLVRFGRDHMSRVDPADYLDALLRDQLSASCNAGQASRGPLGWHSNAEPQVDPQHGSSGRSSYGRGYGLRVGSAVSVAEDRTRPIRPSGRSVEVVAVAGARRSKARSRHRSGSRPGR